MAKYIIPKRVYTEGKTKLISLRIPVALNDVLLAIALEKGRKISDIIVTVLDQFAQQESKHD